MSRIIHALDQPAPLTAPEGRLRLDGWIAGDTGVISEVRLRLASGEVFDCEAGQARPDVAAAYSDVSGAGSSGFALETYLPPGLNIATFESRRPGKDWSPFQVVSILTGLSPLQFRLETAVAPVFGASEIYVSGWCFHPQAEIGQLSMQFAQNEVVLDSAQPRTDVAALFPGISTSLRSGFVGHLPLQPGAGPVILTARLRNGAVLRATVHPELQIPDPALQRAKEQAWKARAASICLPRSHQPRVSIVVPVFNQIECTLTCLEAIVREATAVPFEVVVVNDRSDPPVTEALALVRGLRLVTNEANLGFVLSCNRGAMETHGEYVLFLNNDTEVQRGWMEAMLDIFARRPDAGLVGAKLAYPDGALQEAGGILWADGSAWNYGRNQDAARPEYNYVRETDYCSGACLMVPRKFWQELGGFDERFAPAYCEDSDLAMQVRAAGRKVYYQPAAVVVHHEGKSNGTELSNGVKQHQVANTVRLFEKWRPALEAGHRPNGVDVFRARERSLNRKTILFIDHYLPHYDRDAGSRTIWSYLEFFLDQGFSVKFLGDNFHPHEPYLTEMQQKGIEVLHGPWYAAHWERWLEEVGPQLDYVLLSRAHVSPRYLAPLRRHTKAELLFYGHDLVSRSMEREYALTGNPAVLASAAKWRQMEEAVFKEVDVAYYPSDDEVRYLTEHYPRLVARVLPPYVYKEPPRNGFAENLSSRAGLLFVGGFNHPPNPDAMLWFHREVWPEVRRKFPSIHLTIAGSNPPEEILDLAGQDVTVTGYVSEAKLAELYAAHLFAVIPLRFGGGVKGKIVEALWHGLPVLTTPVGAEGIPEAESCLFISSLEDFAANLERLLRSPEKLAAFATAGAGVIARHYSTGALHEAYSQDICLS